MGLARLKELAPFAREALSKTARVANILCFLHVTNTYICTFAKLVGTSMLPTFHHGNFVLAESITRRLGKIGLGDLVIVRSPEDPTKVVAKRVKGVEGDVVSYMPDPKTTDENQTVVVPEGHVWVEGDNAYDSRDSRQFGPVPHALLCSRIFFVVWPPEDFRSIRKQSSMFEDAFGKDAVKQNWRQGSSSAGSKFGTRS